ncbi:MAG TPA: hypothetical protein VEL07_14905 [Planctomycetota bacterium]|nr:hypothetical protein [Planctomycetota bacterium]
MGLGLRVVLPGLRDHGEARRGLLAQDDVGERRVGDVPDGDHVAVRLADDGRAVAAADDAQRLVAAGARDRQAAELAVARLGAGRAAARRAPIALRAAVVAAADQQQRAERERPRRARGARVRSNGCHRCPSSGSGEAMTVTDGSHRSA